MSYTPGPWQWLGHRKGPMRLSGKGMMTVLDFVRQGMRGAQPRFQVDGLMIEAADLAIQEVEYRDDIIDIAHPDARLIAAAPDLLRAAEAIDAALRSPELIPLRAVGDLRLAIAKAIGASQKNGSPNG